MGYPDKENNIKDMGGRRRVADRRNQTTRYRFPERRWNKHRRSGSDRRNIYTQRFYRGKERRTAFKTTIEFVS